MPFVTDDQYDGLILKKFREVAFCDDIKPQADMAALIAHCRAQAAEAIGRAEVLERWNAYLVKRVEELEARERKSLGISET